MQNSSQIHGQLKLGFGCSGAWGKKWFSENKARAVVEHAIENGVSHFDTAGFYGEAESRLGKVLADQKNAQIFVSSKVGTYAAAADGRLAKDFSRGAIIRCVDASLQNLDREQLDLLYLHGPNDDQMREAAPTLEYLRQQGKINLVGVCGEGRFLEQAATFSYVDVIMGAYNVFRREHAPVFSTAKTHGKKVVVIAPLAQGLYRPDFLIPRSLADGWHVARALVKNRAELKVSRDNADILTLDGWKPAEVAMAFVLANPDVDLAVTTTTKIPHLDESIRAATKLLPENALKSLNSWENGP